MGLCPIPRLLARGDPYAPLRFVAGAHLRAVMVRAPYPGSSLAGTPYAPLRFVAGAHLRAVMVRAPLESRP